MGRRYTAGKIKTVETSRLRSELNTLHGCCSDLPSPCHRSSIASIGYAIALLSPLPSASIAPAVGCVRSPHTPMAIEVPAAALGALRIDPKGERRSWGAVANPVGSSAPRWQTRRRQGCLVKMPLGAACNVQSSAPPGDQATAISFWSPTHCRRCSRAGACLLARQASQRASTIPLADPQPLWVTAAREMISIRTKIVNRNGGINCVS